MSEYKEIFKRTEIKYLLNEEQYQSLMSYLEGFAKIDAYGLSKINNIYYDTPDYRLIRTSMEKPMYKEKLRLRTYGSTGDDTNSFIEIKKKYNGIVYKRRISGRYSDTYKYLSGLGKKTEDSQISREIESFLKTYEGLKPAMSICYDRIALAGIDDPDFRVTFDTNIRWNDKNLDLRNTTDGIPILPKGMYLMEIKVANAMPVGLARKLSEYEIYPTSFSKYGRGYEDMMKRELMAKTAKETAAVYTHLPNTVKRKGVAAYV